MIFIADFLIKITVVLLLICSGQLLCKPLYHFPHRSPRKQILYPTSSPLVGDKQPIREVSPQSSSESDYVGMNQTPPTGAYRTQSVGATISTAAQHASPKLILPSSCANDYSQIGLISLIRKILNPQRKSFVLSYIHWHEDFLQGESSCTLIVPAGGRLIYHSLGRKVYTAFSMRTVFIWCVKNVKRKPQFY